MTQRRPLILSALDHDIHASAVRWVLHRRGIPAVWIRSWADPAMPPLSLYGDKERGLRLLGGLGGAIGSVWFRRPRHPESFPGAAPADVPFLRGEWARYVNNLQAMAPGLADALWVNPPAAAAATENKLVQLRAAHRCGLRFPATLVSCDPGEIRRFAAAHGRIVYKPFQTHTWQAADGRMYSTYARIVEPAMLQDDASLRQCPGIYQQLVDKRYDLRVTIVGRRMFPIRLDAPPGGDFVDWRVSSLGKTLRARPAKLPAAYEQRLQRLMGELGLAYGCVDLAIDADGEAHFLEINQAGQFLFLEDAAPEVPLLRAVAAMLAEGRADYALESAGDASYADYLASDEHHAWWETVRHGIHGEDGAIPGVSRE